MTITHTKDHPEIFLMLEKIRHKLLSDLKAEKDLRIKDIILFYFRSTIASIVSENTFRYQSSLIFSTINFENNLEIAKKYITDKIYEDNTWLQLLTQVKNDISLFNYKTDIERQALKKVIDDLESSYINRFPGWKLKEEIIIYIKKKVVLILKKEKGEQLRVKVYKWLEDSKFNLPSWKYNAIQKKMHFLESSLLWEEWTSFEQAKSFISEVFYPNQEEFYQNLEKWARNIIDKDCSSWISFYLYHGRTIPIKHVKVLQFHMDIDKAKDFLMKEYHKKQEWDKIKETTREKNKTSIFDKFNETINSLNEVLFPFDIDKPIYTSAIEEFIVSCETRDRESFDDQSGFTLKRDTIKYSIFVQHLTLTATNKFYCSYFSTYRKAQDKYIFYSREAVSLIREYLNHITNKNFCDDNVIGLVTHVGKNSIDNSRTFILYQDPNRYNTKPLVKFYQYVFANSKNMSLAQPSQLFVKAILYSLRKYIGLDYDYTLTKVYSETEQKEIENILTNQYNNLSYNEKYSCHILDCTKFCFPKDVTKVNKQIFIDSRYINLYHCITYEYNTRPFEDYLFEYARIQYEFGDTAFKILADNVGMSFLKASYNIISLNLTNNLFLIKLRILLFINWLFVSSNKQGIKKLSAIWLYYILYKSCQECSSKDLPFFKELLSYTLIKNEMIFEEFVVNIIPKCNNILRNCTAKDIKAALYYTIKDYSNNFKGNAKEMKYNHKQYLSRNIFKCYIFKEYKESNNTLETTKVNLYKKFPKELFSLISAILENESYTSKSVLKILENIKKYPIPNNFHYTNTSNNTFSRCKYDSVNLLGDYKGTYAHDVMGYSNSDIDTIFDGDPNAYWNID